ncbi:MAG: DegT/DnrJ/EryC1/StrS family aminotransferase [Candidatus Levybacteria bacterium]|nr:DegT/DnrJ/EryC1/StrS family aminotransferase [Candidatus Levybacteria bacterium]
MIPLVDLSRLETGLKNQIQEKIKDIVRKGNYILGEELEIFETEFAEYCERKYCVGVASGTDAIFLALVAIGIKNGDEVIAPANTFISTVLPAVHLKAKPVLVDIDPQTYNIDPQKIEEKISSKTRAIISVHLYGQPASMDKILQIAKKYKLRVIEDACQAHGAIYKGKKAGSLSDIACFSFYAGKNLGCFGDGGAIVTNSKKLADKIKTLRNIGQKKKYHHIEKGFNSRLDTIQAAVLSAKLLYLDKWNLKRRRLASEYNRLLEKLSVVIPFEPEKYISNYHLYVIRVKKRDQLLEYLKSKGIFCGIHYPIPIHLQKSMKELGYKKGDFPITEKYAKEIISLPIFPQLRNEEVAIIAKYIKEFYENK